MCAQQGGEDWELRGCLQDMLARVVGQPEIQGRQKLLTGQRHQNASQWAEDFQIPHTGWGTPRTRLIEEAEGRKELLGLLTVEPPTLHL